MASNFMRKHVFLASLNDIAVQVIIKASYAIMCLDERPTKTAQKPGRLSFRN